MIGRQFPEPYSIEECSIRAITFQTDLSALCVSATWHQPVLAKNSKVGEQARHLTVEYSAGMLGNWFVQTATAARFELGAAFRTGSVGIAQLNQLHR